MWTAAKVSLVRFGFCRVVGRVWVVVRRYGAERVFYGE